MGGEWGGSLAPKLISLCFYCREFSLDVRPVVKEGVYMVILCKCFGFAAYATVANLSPYQSNRIDVYPNLRVEKLHMDGLVKKQCLKQSTYMNVRC